MAAIENHFTVFIRLPFERGNFVDPPPVSWSAAKERTLWNVISRQAKENDIDWTGLSQNLEVTQSFLLQQAAWLYERQLSQVRAQMRKVGARASATPSPAPGSVSGSMMGGQTMKRGGSGGSRVPSRLSIHARDSPNIVGETSVPGTPPRARHSLPLRAPSGLLSSQLRGITGTSSPISRQLSKESNTPTSGQFRRGSMQQYISKLPAQGRQISANSSDSDDLDTAASRVVSRRQNPSATPRRTTSRRDAEARRPTPINNDDDDDEDDSPSFLPFASKDEPIRNPATLQDPSATLRGVLMAPTYSSQRPISHRRSTSERIAITTAHSQEPMASSTSSNSSGPTPTTSSQQPQAQTNTQIRAATVLSPRQHAAIASLSPRYRLGTTQREGSDTSPSMGSSFSDLDDASVTQSALEEALLSNMARGNSNGSSTTGNGGGMASRVSGISQALRSRYFDVQQ
jgi:Atg29 N-terminal domain